MSYVNSHRSSPIHANYSSFDEIDPGNVTESAINNNSNSSNSNRIDNNNNNNIHTKNDAGMVDPLAAPETQQNEQLQGIEDVNDDETQLSSSPSWRKFGPRTNSNSNKKSKENDKDKKNQRSDRGVTTKNNNNNNNNKNDTTTFSLDSYNTYRGFSTSIHDTYLYNEHERTDCCSITCCGVLQLDRNRYLLTGMKPPSLIKRCTVHIMIPLTIFITSGVAALHIKNIAINELTCIGLLLTLLTYCCLAIQRGIDKKRTLRHDLLVTKYQIQQQHLLELQNEQDERAAAAGRSRSVINGTSTAVVSTLMNTPSSEEEDDVDEHGRIEQVTASKSYHNTRFVEKDESYYLLGQTKRDIKRAHPCCILGCYPDDRRKDEEEEEEDNDNDEEAAGNSTGRPYYTNRRRIRETNCCSRALNSLLNPLCCGSALQCGTGCSVCAIAQEAREIDRTILPPEYRRIDYITLEPFANYYPLIYKAKMLSHQRNQQIYGYITPTTTSSNTAVLLANEVHPNQINNNVIIVNENTRNDDQSQNRLEQNNISSDEDLRKYSIPADIKTYGICGIPLSRLSYRLVQSYILFALCMFTWVYVSPLYYKHVMGRNVDNTFVPMFTIAEFFVLLATMFHAIAFLSMIVYCTNYIVRTKASQRNQNQLRVPVHSQLSIDALIKFFATGFFLSASLAFFWEVVAVIVVNIVVTLLLAISGIDIKEQDELQGINGLSGDGLTDDDTYYFSSIGTSSSLSLTWNTFREYITPLATGSQFALLPQRQRRPLAKALANVFVPSWLAQIDTEVDETSAGTATEYVELFGYDHPFLYTIYIAVGAFFVAAFIEEVCKYYGFRMSEEHPDFLTQRDLIDASKVVRYHNKSEGTTTGTGGQLRSSSNDEEEEEEELDDDEVDNNGITNYERFDDTNGRQGSSQQNQNGGGPTVSNSATINTLYPNQLKSKQGHGAAITLAMVAVAIGFGCCENLIYVFVYAGGSVAVEVGVLIERALFPLHPIVAAIQSIGVCHLQLERTKGYHIGYILLPAVIIHGCFDFFILWIDFLGKLQQQQQNQQQQQGQGQGSNYYGDPNDGNNNNHGENVGGDETQQQGYDNGGDAVDLDGTNPVMEALSISTCILIMLAGISYFVIRANQQRERLAELDRLHQINNRVPPSSSLI